MSRRRRALGIGLIAMAAVVAYLLLWPSTIDPVAWDPPLPAPQWPDNEDLSAAERFAEGIGTGPEDVALGPDGLFYTGLEDGSILRFLPDGSGVETFAKTGGRPLGMQFDRDGELVVADAERGLLRIDAGGSVAVLTDSVEGGPIPFADDLDIAKDGVIWFSDATSRPDQDTVLDALEGKATGRLLSYRPQEQETTVHLEGLRFANGISLAADELSVLFAETFGYRITRYHIAGPRMGEVEPFADNLPGMPDNINLGPTGVLWVALIKRRDPLLDNLYPYPGVRKIFGRLPHWMLPVGAPFGFVAGLDASGNVVHNLQDPNGVFGDITSATPFGDHLVLGSLHEFAVARVENPAR